MSTSSSVWDRRGTNVLPKNLYMFLVCFWTAFGIASSAVAASLNQTSGLNWMIFLGLFVVSLIGTFITVASDKPILSLVGYMMVTIPFGWIVGPLLTYYTDASISKIFFATTGMVVVLGVIGAIIPQSLESWAGWLFGGLTIVLIGLFIIPIAGMFGLPIETAMTVWDWVGIVLFGGYVIYDLNRAARLPYTHDNAIDSALAVYLDFVNIFIRLLSLFGDKKGD